MGLVILFFNLLWIRRTINLLKRYEPWIPSVGDIAVRTGFVRCGDSRLSINLK
jgi:hypothetical protein